MRSALRSAIATIVSLGIHADRRRQEARVGNHQVLVPKTVPLASFAPRARSLAMRQVPMMCTVMSSDPVRDAAGARRCGGSSSGLSSDGRSAQGQEDARARRRRSAGSAVRDTPRWTVSEIAAATS
jgi:hypothetical protein